MTILKQYLVTFLAISTVLSTMANSLKEEINLTRRTLSLIKSSSKISILTQKLNQLQKEDDGSENEVLLADILSLRREIIFSHPALDFKKLLINKRPPPTYSHNVDQYLGRHSRIGDGLTVLDNWKTKPKETVILKGKLPYGSVLHPDLSFDGKKILFSFCDHSENNKSFRRFWIYEAAIDGSNLRQITGTGNDKLERRNNRETVLIEDFDPAYLPDGGMVFTSTRSQNFGRCHGGRYTPSYLLYRGALDGTKIRQISFGEANELDPSVLPDGRIVYTRWEYINRHDTQFHSLWTIRPDGTGTEHFYGNYTRSPYMLAETRSIPGTRKVISTASAHHSFTAGSIVTIDPSKGQDGVGPLKRLTPEAVFPESEGFKEGTYVSPYPITENIFFAAYNKKKHVHQGQIQDISGYDIYLVYHIDGKAYKEFIYSDPKMSSFSPTPIRSRRIPAIIPSRLDNNTEKMGTYFVQNIYESQQPFEKGSVASLRVNRILNQPAALHNQRSVVQNENVKQILGTVPVNPDGSVAFRAPAGIPLQLQALDKNGMALLTMRSFIYLHAGEIVSCVGCHESKNTTPSMGRVTLPINVHDLTPPAGPQYNGGFNFVKTVQPVLDRYCIKCHGLRNDREIFSLIGKPVQMPNQNGRNISNRLLTSESYDFLVKNKKLIKLAHRNKETVFSRQKEYFAHASKLIEMIDDRHGKVKVDKESRQRVVDWLDLNCQFYGNYSFNRVEERDIDKEAEEKLRKEIKKQFGKKLAEQPLEALVNRSIVTESRILKAPLAEKSGGWGFFESYWKSTSDSGYLEMLQLVKNVFKPLPYEDINGTCGRDKCMCRSCWVRRYLNKDK